MVNVFCTVSVDVVLDLIDFFFDCFPCFSSFLSLLLLLLVVLLPCDSLSVLDDCFLFFSDGFSTVCWVALEVDLDLMGDDVIVNATRRGGNRTSSPSSTTHTTSKSNQPLPSLPPGLANVVPTFLSEDEAIVVVAKRSEIFLAPPSPSPT